MKTVLQTIQSGTPYLEKAGVESARLNMEYLLAHVMGCKRMDLYLRFNEPLEEKTLDPLRELTRRRARREPLQHLLGTVEFMGREYLSDGRALIPRPETEELVERIVAHFKKLSLPAPARILDMGTGSGVIGLSLAHAFPGAQVTLADVSPDALSLAAENRVKTGVPGERVRLILTDLFENIDGGPFDLVVANLPYIGAEEMLDLPAEVQRDPALALDGGPIGTEIIARFLTGLAPHVTSGALIALETGLGQSGELLALMDHLGLREARSVSDYSGRDRFLFSIAP